MRIALDVLGDRVLEREFLRIGDRAADLRPAWRDAFDVIERYEEVMFASEGRPIGGWAPLAASTEARKQGPSILTETGALRASLTGRGGDAIREIGAHEAAFGTKVPYAGFHQHGTARMPARPVVRFSELVKVHIMREVQRHIFDSKRAA